MNAEFGAKDGKGFGAAVDGRLGAVYNVVDLLLQKAAKGCRDLLARFREIQIAALTEFA